MRYLIFGTGAIGGYFGGRLLQYHHHVDFIARGQQLDAIKSKGLEIKSINGNTTLDNVNVSQQINAKIGREVEAGYDVIFIAVKSYQLEQAVKEIKDFCSHNDQYKSQHNPIIIPLLNGIDVEQKLIAYGLEAKQVINAFANIICQVRDYGVIEHTAGEPHITLGVKTGFHTQTELAQLQGIIEKVANDLINARIKVSIKADITDAIWAKYLFVAPWAAISSMVEQPLGVIREHADCYAMHHQLIEEYYIIAQAEGIQMPERVIENIKKGLEHLPPESTTSMQNDVALGKACEFETLVASAFSLAQKHQLKTPLLTWCKSCLSAKLNTNSLEQ